MALDLLISYVVNDKGLWHNDWWDHSSNSVGIGGPLSIDLQCLIGRFFLEWNANTISFALVDQMRCSDGPISKIFLPWIAPSVTHQMNGFNYGQL